MGPFQKTLFHVVSLLFLSQDQGTSFFLLILAEKGKLLFAIFAFLVTTEGLFFTNFAR